jgi:hypothetical protein
MKYLLLMYADEAVVSGASKEDFQAAAARQPGLSGLAKTWADFAQEIAASGVLIANSGLAPVANATTVRVRQGKTLITDGPFAETHEQLGGYFLVECEDLDEAIRWAERIPTAKYGSVEVRPLWSEVSGT